jgi:hypothetical protein
VFPQISEMAVPPPPAVVGGDGTDRLGMPAVVGEVEEEEAVAGSKLPRPSTEEGDESGIEPDPDPDSWSSLAPSFALRAGGPLRGDQGLRHLVLSDDDRDENPG